MSILRHREAADPSISFPLSRTGYERSTVNDFTQMVRTRLESVLTDNDRLVNDNERLKARVSEFEAAARQRGYDPVATQQLVHAESARLLASAQWHADAIRTDAKKSAQMVVESARLEAAALLGAANNEAAALRQRLADDRQRCADELFAAHQEATKAAQALLTEATAQQGKSAAHLNQEALDAAGLREEVFVWAHNIHEQAVTEAAELVARANHDAAVIDERVRQESAWRGRHLRDEQALVTSRRLELLGQLASLRALAEVGTATLADLPELETANPPAAIEPPAIEPGGRILSGG